MIGKTQKQFGINVEEPQWIEIPKNDQVNHYIDAIKSDIDP